MRTAVALLMLLAWGPPAVAASLELDAEPIVLGKTETVGVTLRVPEPARTPRPALRLVVNVGTFSEVTRQGPGVYRSVYTPPATRFPQVARVVVWHDTGPDAELSALTIPLSGTTRVEVRTRPRAQVRGTVGGRTFGPVRAGPHGLALLPIEVSPDIHTLEVTTRQRDGATATHRVPIQVPPYNRITVALVTPALLADGRGRARVDVFHPGAEEGVGAALVQLRTELGTITRVATSDGHEQFQYQPPTGTLETEARLQARIEGEAASVGTVRVALSLPAPAQLVLHPPETPLPADGTSRAELSLQVYSASGSGLPAQHVEVWANGQPLQGVTDAGSGLYRVPFVAPAFFPPGGLVRFEATVSTPSGPSARTEVRYQLRPPPIPRALHAALAQVPVPADGSTRVRLALDVRDAAGLPLDGARLIVVANQGAVSPPRALADGRYESMYLAPSGLPEDPVELTITDASGQFVQRVPVPLRAPPHRLLLGVRAGVVHGAQLGPRAGLEAWVPFAVRGHWWGLGLAAAASRFQRNVQDTTGSLTSRSEAWALPVSLRAGVELFASRRASLVLGAGGTATWARFRTSLSDTRVEAMGLGGLGFLTASYALGPGQLFTEASYVHAPVSASGFRLDAGGPGLDVGYRIGVL
ncbi:hypothetical protein DRW03_07150 [Corallococcus sp. H22C18031201]|nr:hypothetical protein DRW03_07150 [Corallococcus sp. H22C18031201]